MKYNIEKSKWLMSLPEKYRPNSVQKIVALSNEDTRNKVFFGDRQSGRSYILLLDAIYDAITRPNIRIAIMGIYRPNMYLLETMNEMIREIGYEDILLSTTRNPSKIELKNGTIILFLSRDIDFRGHKINNLYIDNLENIREYDLDVAVSCTITCEDRKIVANCIANNPPEHATKFAEGLLRGN